MGRSQLTIVGLLALPLVGLAILLAAPEADVHWQHEPTHFWLVLLTAGLNAVLAYGTAPPHGDAATGGCTSFSLSFLAASGFLALHALATPGVPARPAESRLRDRDAGGPRACRGTCRAVRDRQRADPAEVSRAGTPRPAGAVGGRLPSRSFPGGDSVVPERLSGEMLALSVAGIVFYTFAVVRYLALYRERRSPLVLGFTVAFILLAEAMVAVALGRNWQASWWEWHLLMLIAFGVIAVMAHPTGLGGAVRPPVRRTRCGARDRPVRRPGGLHVVLGASRAGGGLENAGHALRERRPCDRASRRC